MGDHNGRDSGLPRGYLRACLLLLVAESSVHGYEVVAKLTELGLIEPDAATVYRTLRRLDDDGLVQSWWATSKAGPARRLYRATEAGVACLEDLTAELEEGHRHLSSYLERRRTLAASRTVPGERDGPPGRRSPDLRPPFVAAAM